MEALLDEVLEMKMMVDLLDGKDNVANFQEKMDATKTYLNAVEETLRRFKDEQLEKIRQQKALVERVRKLQRRYKYMSENMPPDIPSPKQNKQEVIPRKVAQKEEPKELEKPKTVLKELEKPKSVQKELEKPKAKPKQVEALNPKQKVNGDATPEPRKGLEASINYVTTSEMSKISSYMRGRLKLADVNALVDIYNNVLNKKEKLLNKKSLRSKDEMDLVHMWKSQRNCASLQGQYFCSVDDFKTQENLKFGKKEFSIIVILRHVNKIKEVREGGKIFYVACF